MILNMYKDQNRLRLIIYAVFTLASLIILIDFALPGKQVRDEISDVQRERQQYYNAARNFHYSYKIITSNREIYVTEDFAALELVNKEIEYAVSRIFRKINWYRLAASEDKSFHSLRIFSGLVLPLLYLILVFISLQFKKRIGTLIFILQILLLLT